MVCKNCGAELKDGARFCNKCGAKQPEVAIVGHIDKTAQTEQRIAGIPQQAPQQQMPPQPQPQVQPQQQAQAKSSGGLIAIIVILIIVILALGGWIVYSALGSDDDDDSSSKSKSKADTSSSQVESDDDTEGSSDDESSDENDESSEEDPTATTILPQKTTTAPSETTPPEESSLPSITLPNGGSSPEVIDLESKGIYEYNGHYYKVFSTYFDWDFYACEDNCVSMGGHLVSINSQGEQDFVMSILGTGIKTDPNYWIGLVRDGASWRWLDGSQYTYSNWDMWINDEGEENWQPDNYENQENAVRLAAVDQQFEYWKCNKGGWLDTNEKGDSDAPLDSFGYVCEWSGAPAIDLLKD